MTLPFTGFVVPAGGGSGGGVTGLTSADGGDAIADNEVVRGDGTTGIQGSVALLTDAGALSGLTQLDVDNIRTDGNTISSTNANGDINISPNGSGMVTLTQANGLAGIKGGLTSFLMAGPFNGEWFMGSGKVDSSAFFHFDVNGDQFALRSDMQFVWTNSATNAITTRDTGLARNAAGVIRATNGSTGLGSLLSGVLVEANTAGSGAPNVIVANESGTTYTNEGSTAQNYHTLPTAVAGYVFEFIVQDTDGIRIVANTDDTIRVIDKVTATAGYIESTTIGSTVRLVSINAVEWFATSIHGVWTDGTFTFDDTGSTSP